MAFVIARHVVACTCVYCVNVGPLPAVRRDVVDDDVVRSGRVAHGIAARRRSEYAKPNFSYITLIPRSQMSVIVEYRARPRGFRSPSASRAPPPISEAQHTP